MCFLNFKIVSSVNNPKSRMEQRTFCQFVPNTELTYTVSLTRNCVRDSNLAAVKSTLWIFRRSLNYPPSATYGNAVPALRREK